VRLQFLAPADGGPSVQETTDAVFFPQVDRGGDTAPGFFFVFYEVEVFFIGENERRRSTDQLRRPVTAQLCTAPPAK
jgi:hypothetical protein